MTRAQKSACRVTAETVAVFQAALLEKEYAPGTVENYIRSVRAFAAWSGGMANREQVLAWKARLAKSHAPATVNTMLAGLNRFFLYQSWPDCYVKPLRLQRRSFQDPERELEEAEYRRLVHAARVSGKRRLALVLETLCATGIRVGEARYITVEAARRGKAGIALKGKIRTILLPGSLCRKLLLYAKQERIASGVIFRTRGGAPLSRTQIWAEMKRLCPLAGVAESKVFPHNLRHLFARTFYDLYHDIVKLADILGHSSMDTTRLYLITSGAEHLRQMERMRLLC